MRIKNIFLAKLKTHSVCRSGIREGPVIVKKKVLEKERKSGGNL